MGKHLIIGISGKPHAGKDTVASMIEKEFPGIYRINFSAAITKEYDANHGTRTSVDEQEKDRHRAGISDLAHKRRLEDPEYWVKRTLVDDRPLLVAGVRAVAEADAVKRTDGFLVRVVVSEATLRQRMGQHYDRDINHVVENHLNDYTDWDYIIHNDGTLEDLEEAVKKVAKQIKNEYAHRN
ncbi:hypothetical protein KGQ71_04750 [Patescibacteria group bacterium]|nr:hypothetical protein [Patescibacteria group bacterium]